MFDPPMNAPGIAVPAVCDTCGTAFPSLIRFSGGGGVRTLNMGSGPCPRCGGRGTIPDASYSIIDGVLKARPLHGLSGEQLRSIQAQLQPVVLQDLSEEQLRTRLTEALPNAAPTLLREVLTRSEILTLIQVILALIAIYLSTQGPSTVNIDNSTHIAAVERREPPAGFVDPSVKPHKRRRPPH